MYIYCHFKVFSSHRYYLLKKNRKAISATIATENFTFNNSIKFDTDLPQNDADFTQIGAALVQN